MPHCCLLEGSGNTLRLEKTRMTEQCFVNDFKTCQGRGKVLEVIDSLPSAPYLRHVPRDLR